jgi:hypothetical protein
MPWMPSLYEASVKPARRRRYAGYFFILSVEHEGPVRAYLEQQLLEDGFEVLSAAHGKLRIVAFAGVADDEEAEPTCGIRKQVVERHIGCFAGVAGGDPFRAWSRRSSCLVPSQGIRRLTGLVGIPLELTVGASWVALFAPLARHSFSRRQGKTPVSGGYGCSRDQRSA